MNKKMKWIPTGEWTPGEWKIGYGGMEGDDYAVIISPCRERAICNLEPRDYHQANAHLIAAAPNTYEALIVAEKAMIKLNDKLSEMGKGLDDGYGTPFDIVAIALAKARGEV